ncbi:AI-2E family transporter [uncultured Amnibacterium sp.]|uniref:AI-2E family transporter n=1 Tax=uncultured Amnibacterium sp. TaxID=1631851 RepID=UPI0035CB36F7
MARRADPSDEAEDAIARAVPVAVRIAGAWSWPIVGVLILAAVLVFLVIQLHVVVVPILVAVLITGLTNPAKLWLMQHRWPRGLAVAATFLGLLVVVAALITLVVLTIRSGLEGIQGRTVAAYRSLLSALNDSALGISTADVQSAIDSATKWVQENASTILSGALTGASTIGDIGVGLVLSLFITLFLLIDGAGVWRWLVRLAPKRARAAVDGGGRAAWISVGQYVRVQIVVALIDAIGIGLVALILGLPFVVPIAVLVFLAAFIPFVGAIVTGGLAVLVALVYAGPVPAVIMLAGVVGVNQLESHVLQPLLMGTAVRLHPVAVVLAVSSGSILAGIGGAVFAVPLAAAVNSAVKYIAGGAWQHEPPPPAGPMPREPEQGGPAARRRRRRAAEPEDVTTVA